MAVLGFYLLDKLGGDEIQFYINPRFTLLVLLVTLVFFILAQRILFNRPDDPSTEINQRPVTGSRWAVLSLLMLILPITADLIGQSLPQHVIPGLEPMRQLNRLAGNPGKRSNAPYGRAKGGQPPAQVRDYRKEGSAPKSGNPRARKWGAKPSPAVTVEYRNNRSTSARRYEA